MSKDIFEEYINLVIVDASIIVFNNSEFDGYYLFTNYITKGIEDNNYGGVEMYMLPILGEVTDILGISVKESATYVAKFFKYKKYEDYYLKVKEIKSKFNIFLVS